MTSSKVRVKKEGSIDDFEFFDGKEIEDVGNFDVKEIEDIESFEIVEANNFDLCSKAKESLETVSSGVALVLAALCTVTEEQGLVFVLPVKALTTTVVSAIAGSLMAGLPGMTVGVITGAILAYKSSCQRDKCSKPSTNQVSKKSTLRQIFTQMTVSQKKELIKELFACLKHGNVSILVKEIIKNPKVRNIAINILSNFLQSKMGFKLSKI